jgi:hypothetical protein
MCSPFPANASMLFWPASGSIVSATGGPRGSWKRMAPSPTRCRPTRAVKPGRRWTGCSLTRAVNCSKVATLYRCLESCGIGVSFTPQAAVARNGSLVVTDDANAAPRLERHGAAHRTWLPAGRTLSAATLSPGANLGSAAAPQVVPQTAVLFNAGTGCSRSAASA